VNRTDVAVARHALRQVVIGAGICAVVFGASAASSAVTYVSTFPDQADRVRIAASTSADTGLAVLLGPVAGIDTVGGYTFYKVFVFLTTIGAVWAVLAATRVLRGEEDRGRWQLLLVGATRAPRATAATLCSLGLAVGMILVGTAGLTAAAGLDPDVGFSLRSSVTFGLSIVLAPAVFIAVGAFTSQLGRTRRMATGLGMGVLAVTFAVRMVSDAGPATAWLRWWTPFGWSELMEPFTSDDLRPLLPAVTLIVVLCVATVVASARRDAGDGVLASREVAPPRWWGLRSSTGLAVRLELPGLVWWCVGALATGLMLGVIAKMTESAIPASMQDMLGRLGLRGRFAEQYFGVAFLLVAAVVALVPAGQIGAAAEEERTGRLVRVLVGPTRRVAWLGGRLGVAAVAVLVSGVLAGAGAWIGAWTQGVDVSAGRLLVAGLNVVPTALVALGVGALVLALVPRAAAGAVYLVVAWSFIVDLFSSLVSGLQWMERLSLFHYLALAPGQDPDPVGLLVTTLVALALCGVAAIVFGRRDLHAP
jgi:ABC-2 type transport system permease protein